MSVPEVAYRQTQDPAAVENEGRGSSRFEMWLGSTRANPIDGGNPIGGHIAASGWQ